MKSRAVTPGRIRELYNYDPETGIFTRRVKTGRSTVVGEAVGSLALNGYLRITVDNVRLLAHRAAWMYSMDEIPDGDIDHINGDRQDNRLCNLRKATRSENMQNERRSRAGSKSGLLGAFWHSASGKWMARVRIPGGHGYEYLGLFETAEQANAAYIAAKRRLHPFNTI